MSQGGTQEHGCGSCGKAGASLMCPCKAARYCGKECQKEQWKRHKKACSHYLASMRRDGRYHFDDGRGPDDPSAVCMSVGAFKAFETLKDEHPDTWEEEYGDKGKWVFIEPDPNAA